MKWASVYPLYIAKAERKGRSREEVDQLIYWLTGYDKNDMERLNISDIDLEHFYREASNFNEASSLIKGKVCGVEVSTIEDEVEQKMRYMDKIIDELAKGKSLDKIMRK